MPTKSLDSTQAAASAIQAYNSFYAYHIFKEEHSINCNEWWVFSESLNGDSSNANARVMDKIPDEDTAKVQIRIAYNLKGLKAPF